MIEITPSLIVSILAVGISGISLYWAFKSWKQTYRPLITARVTTHEEHGVIALDLVVRNTGNRPALNIRLSVDPGDLETAFFAKSDNDRRKAAERCFSDPILVIENGSEISHSFGAITPDEKKRTWKEPMVLNVRIQYRDLDGRVYHNYQPLRIRGEDRYPDPSWG